MALMLSLFAMADHVLIRRFRPYYRVERKKDWAFVCTARKPEKRFAMGSNAPAGIKPVNGTIARERANMHVVIVINTDCMSRH